MQEVTSRSIETSFDPALESALALKVLDYVHPIEVVQDDRLGPADKRAILSTWASDACAVESRPGFRWLRGTPGPILVDHVLAPLRALDEASGLHLPRHGAVAGCRPEHMRHGRARPPSAEGDPTIGGTSR